MSALVSIVLLGAFLRYWRIDSMPYGMTNDEGGQLYTALSLWRTGRSLDGRLFPLNFNLDNSYSPVFAYLMAPIVGILGAAPTVMRVAYAGMSLIGIILLYGIAKRLFQSEWVGLCSAFVLAVSPWSIHMNRVAYDGPITLFFLWFLHTFLRLHETGRLLWTLPILAVSFYSYYATQVALVAFVPFLVFVFRKTMRKREMIVFVLGFIFIISSFIYVFKTQGITRQNVLIVFDSSSAAETVNYQRQANTAPWVLRVLINNKVTYYAKHAVGQYLEAFSPQFLFLYGEGGIYGSYNHGVLYLIELPLFIIGAYSLLRRKDARVSLLVFGGLLTAPLPSALAVDKSYGLRSILMLPFLAMIIAAGIWASIAYLAGRWNPLKQSGRIMWFGLSLLIAGYSASIVLYLYQYHFRYSVSGAEYWFASSRDVVEYIVSRTNQYDRVWVADPGAMFVFQYGVFAKRSFDEVKRAWNAPWPKSIGSVTFLEKCLNNGKPIDPSADLPARTLYIVRENCHRGVPSIYDIRDRAEPLRVLFKMYERKG